MYSHVKKTKLTQSEYYELQVQYDRTPAPDIEYSLATGEHWMLKYVLEKMGIYTSDTNAAYERAGELLSQGYDDD